MAHKIYRPPEIDRTMYIGRFRGLRMIAFGKQQILDYDVEVNVFQHTLHPVRWVARDEHNKFHPCCESGSAEETMRLVKEMFIEQRDKWQTFELRGLAGMKKLGPQLVTRPARKTG